MTPTNALAVAHLGNGTALHLVDANGILCNRWGTVNGVWKAPRIVPGATATCKRCAKLATGELVTDADTAKLLAR